jgi:hypothetical protein
MPKLVTADQGADGAGTPVTSSTLKVCQGSPEQVVTPAQAGVQCFENAGFRRAPE